MDPIEIDRRLIAYVSSYLVSGEVRTADQFIIAMKGQLSFQILSEDILRELRSLSDINHNQYHIDQVAVQGLLYSLIAALPYSIGKGTAYSIGDITDDEIWTIIASLRPEQRLDEKPTKSHSFVVLDLSRACLIWGLDGKAAAIRQAKAAAVMAALWIYRIRER